MKALSTYILVFWTLVSFATLNSCSGEKTNSKEAASAEDGIAVEAKNESANISISKEQFETAKMEIGSPALASFKQSVKANGYIEASPNGIAKIGAPIEGKVIDIKVTLGQMVKKGQTLFSLESNEIILLQQEYAVSKSQLQLLKSNLERIKSLSVENITAKKDLIKAESEYKTMLSTSEGLKARLNIIGVNPKDVDEGIIHSKAVISSPIDGNITELNLLLGQYLQAGDAQIEVIDSKKLQLMLRVYENDLALLEEGQNINFHLPGTKYEAYDAILTQIGKRIDTESRTVNCVASINKKDSDHFLHGSFVQSDIVTCSREAMALPS
nr:efflux RND transporter periplasmic adaptor subunit [Bacteroidales bacterium]